MTPEEFATRLNALLAEAHGIKFVGCLVVAPTDETRLFRSGVDTYYDFGAVLSAAQRALNFDYSQHASSLSGAWNK